MPLNTRGKEVKKNLEDHELFVGIKYEKGGGDVM
jgi:hypothetical protein